MSDLDVVEAERDVAGRGEEERYAGIGWSMVLHGVSGALALCIAPFQFSSRLRQRHIRVHRFMGRVYVFCVAVAAGDGRHDTSPRLDRDHCDRPFLCPDGQDPATS